MTGIDENDRRALIDRIEHVNELAHRLILHQQNIEDDLARKDREIAQLKAVMNGDEEVSPELDACRQLVDHVWGKGESIYSDRAVELVTAIRSFQ